MLFIENLLSVFIGAFLAFGFSFLIQEYLLEKRSMENKIRSLEIINVLADDLHAILELNPDNFPHYQINPYEVGLFSLVELEESKNHYIDLSRLYRHWRNKNYCDDGPGINDISETKNNILMIIDGVNALKLYLEEQYTNRPSLSRWLFMKVHR